MTNEAPRKEAAQEAMAQKLAALRERYKAKVRGLVVDMRAALERARLDEGALVDGFHELHRLAHKVHGTAGTYGLKSTSAAAHDLEQRAERALDAPRPDDVAPMGSLLTRLEAALLED